MYKRKRVEIQYLNFYIYLLFQLIYFILWLIAFGLGYAIVYGPYEEAYKVLDEYFSDSSNVMYGAFHRLIWAVAVAFVVYACHNGYGGT